MCVHTRTHRHTHTHTHTHTHMSTYTHTHLQPFGLRLIPSDSLNVWLRPGSEVNAARKNVFTRARERGREREREEERKREREREVTEKVGF